MLQTFVSIVVVWTAALGYETQPDSRAVELKSLDEVLEFVSNERMALVNFYDAEDQFCRALAPEFVKASYRVHNDSSLQTVLAQFSTSLLADESQLATARRLFEIDPTNGSCPQLRFWSTAHSDASKRLIHFDAARDKRQQYWIQEWVRMQEWPCFDYYSQWPPVADRFADDYLAYASQFRTPPIVYGQFQQTANGKDDDAQLRQLFEEACIYRRRFYDWHNAVRFVLLNENGTIEGLHPEYSPKLRKKRAKNTKFRNRSKALSDNSVKFEALSDGISHKIWVEFTFETPRANLRHSVPYTHWPQSADGLLQWLKPWTTAPVQIADGSTLNHILATAQMGARKVVWIAIEEVLDNRQQYAEFSTPFVDAIFDAFGLLATLEPHRFGERYIFAVISHQMYGDFVRKLGCPFLPCVVVTSGDHSAANGKSDDKYLFDPNAAILSEDYATNTNEEMVAFLNEVWNQNTESRTLAQFRKCPDFENNSTFCYLDQRLIDSFDARKHLAPHMGAVYEAFGTMVDALLCAESQTTDVIILYYVKGGDSDSAQALAAFMDTAKQFDAVSDLLFVTVDVADSDFGEEQISAVPEVVYYPKSFVKKTFASGCVKGGVKLEDSSNSLTDWIRKMRRRLLPPRQCTDLESIPTDVCLPRALSF